MCVRCVCVCEVCDVCVCDVCVCVSALLQFSDMLSGTPLYMGKQRTAINKEPKVRITYLHSYIDMFPSPHRLMCPGPSFPSLSMLVFPLV